MEQMPFEDMGKNDLIRERERTMALIESLNDAVAFAGTILGKKIARKMQGDLEAIRKKYYAIPVSDGSCESLARLQGREQELLELIHVFVSPGDSVANLTKEVEAIDMAISRNDWAHLSMGR